MNRPDDLESLTAHVRSLSMVAPQALDTRVLAISLPARRRVPLLRIAALGAVLTVAAAALIGASRPMVDAPPTPTADSEIRLGFPVIHSARATADRADLVAIIGLEPGARRTPLAVEVLAIIAGDSAIEGSTIELVADSNEYPSEVSPFNVTSLLDTQHNAALVALQRVEGEFERVRFTTWTSPRLEATLVPASAASLPRLTADDVLAFSVANGTVEERRSSAVAIARARGFPVTDPIPSGTLRSAVLKAMNDPDPSVRWQSGLALSTSVGTDIDTAMLRALFDPCRMTRQPASIYFRKTKHFAAIEFGKGLEDYDLDEHTSAPMRDLGFSFGAGRHSDIDISPLDSDHAWLRARTAWQLADHAALHAVSNALIRSLSDSDSKVRRAAAWSLGGTSDELREATRSALADTLDDFDPRVGCAAARSLTLLGDTRGHAWLAFFATSGEDDVALAATEFAGEVGDLRSLAQLTATASHSRPALRAHALLAAVEIARRHDDVHEIVETLLLSADHDMSLFVREAARCARTRIR